MGADGSYDERVLPSIGNEVLKATVAQFDGKSAMPPIFNCVMERR